MSTVLDRAEQDAVMHDRDAFNLAVWGKLSADPEICRLPYRIETDEHGQAIISPPPGPSHGNFQSEVAWRLRTLLESGKVITECPISTRKGVKAADVAWCNDALWKADSDKSCFMQAPDVCVEVISPSNTTSELEEKKSLYFEKGAEEVWLVAPTGEVEFFLKSAPDTSFGKSVIFPDFPEMI